MERRTFVQGAFGLAALVLAGGIADLKKGCAPRASEAFITPSVVDLECAVGPVMEAGICLKPQGDGVIGGFYGDTELFSVDERGAELIRLADGSLALDELAAALGGSVRVADVASFFVTLGRAGYLANTVLVNFVEMPA
jgi:hypothetical protein